MQVEEGQLGDFLVDARLLSRSQLTLARARAVEAGEPLPESLLAMGFVHEDELRRAVAQVHGVPFVGLTREDIDPEALLTIPEPLARAHHIVAYRSSERGVEVALLALADLAALESLRLKQKVLPRLTDRESLRRALLIYQKLLKDHFGDLIARESHAIIEPAEELSAHDARYAAERLPVVHVTDAILRHAILSHASNVHLELREQGLLVRYRIGGVLFDAMQVPKHAARSVMLRLKLLASLILTSGVPQEGRFRIAVGDAHYAVRVTTLQTASGEKISMRLFPEGSGQKGFTLHSLGFHGEGLERVHQLLNKRTGLAVFFGPEKSGITTTLYALLDLLNAPTVSVATIEESVEYHLPYVSQTQTHGETLTSSAALRAVLRGDPDVVMVGNLLSGNTFSLAAHAAQRILMLGGVRAGSLPEAIECMLSQDVSLQLLFSVTRLFVELRLMRRLCAHCKVPRKLTRREEDLLDAAADFGRVLAALRSEGVVNQRVAWKDIIFYKSGDCGHCKGGYQGHLGVQGVLVMTPLLERTLTSLVQGEEVSALERPEGLTLVEDALFKAAQGLVGLEDVLRLVEA